MLSTLSRPQRPTRSLFVLEPLSFGKSYAIEAGGDFTLGFKIDSLGIDTSLKVSAVESSTTTLEANLPSGHLYEVAWLGGPWGVRVTARS